MRKTTTILAVSFVAIFLTVNFVGNKLHKTLIKEQQQYREHIGETHILEKDTLTIVDYSLFKESFTLSNGVEVNKNLIIN